MNGQVVVTLQEQLRMKLAMLFVWNTISITRIVPIGKDVLVQASIVSWITLGMKINGHPVVPKHSEISTTESCLRNDSFACKKVAVSKFTEITISIFS